MEQKKIFFYRNDCPPSKVCFKFSSDDEIDIEPDEYSINSSEWIFTGENMLDMLIKPIDDLNK